MDANTLRAMMEKDTPIGRLLNYSDQEAHGHAENEKCATEYAALLACAEALERLVLAINIDGATLSDDFENLTDDARTALAKLNGGG